MKNPRDIYATVTPPTIGKDWEGYDEDDNDCGGYNEDDDYDFNLNDD